MVESLNNSTNVSSFPDPLVEEPPNDRWCDIVMKGGVASGVVYPWAILEIARHYRLRNIGGTSVGAMAAAIAAACEYGRRKGHPNAFEVLRQLPFELGKEAEGMPGKTVMLSLFQPAKEGQRLFDIFVYIINDHYGNSNSSNKRFRLVRTISKFLSSYLGLTWFTTSTSLIVFLFLWHKFTFTLVFSLSIPIVISMLVLVAIKIKHDIGVGIIKNDLGLCTGKSQIKYKGEDVPALVDWIHEAVQRGAGRTVDGLPLTFEDLWNAPLWPGGQSPRIDKKGLPLERSINLEMVTTNVTHGRPYRLPLVDNDARLFFDPSDWNNIFPKRIMTWLCAESDPYIPKSQDDPLAPAGAKNLYELPSGKLPIVVAARLSLSYPLLFTTVPLYAIDYDEENPEKSKLRLCRLSDGGLCSNFPVHFFDSALPRWPTFGLSLDERLSKDDPAVTLPTKQNLGGHDDWYNLERKYTVGLKPGTAGIPKGNEEPQADFSRLSRFILYAFLSSKDWRDRTAIKMPHVRRRVARLRLISKEGEGQLNIGMPKTMILNMARIYGTEAGKRLCDVYVPKVEDKEPRDAWREHLWIRLQTLLESVGDLLENFDTAITSKGHTLDTNQLLQKATDIPPILCDKDKRMISEYQRDELSNLIDRVAELEHALASRSDIPHTPEPLPELRLRPPL